MENNNPPIYCGRCGANGLSHQLIPYLNPYNGSPSQACADYDACIARNKKRQANHRRYEQEHPGEFID